MDCLHWFTLNAKSVNHQSLLNYSNMTSLAKFPYRQRLTHEVKRTLFHRRMVGVADDFGKCEQKFSHILLT